MCIDEHDGFQSDYTGSKCLKQNRSNMEKAILVADTSDATNWGCHATSTELRKLISGEEVSISGTIFSKDLPIRKSDFIRPNMADFSYILRSYVNFLNGDSSFPHRVYDHLLMPTTHLFDYVPKNTKQLQRRAKKFVISGAAGEYFGDLDHIDHIIINGEGSTHDMSSASYRAVAWRRLFIAYVAKKYFDVKVHIINHLIQTKSETFRELVRTVYPKLDTIIFRDIMSKRHYNRLVGNDDSVLAADAAWLIDDLYTKKELNRHLDTIEIWSSTGQNSQIDFTKPYICIGGGSGLINDFQQMYDQHLDIIRSIREKHPNHNLILTVASEYDSSLMLRLSENTGIPVIGLHNDYSTAASIISNSDVYVGGRWHVSIFALLGGSNLVNFSANTHKISSIGEDIGFHQPIFEYEAINKKKDSIMSEIERAIEGADGNSRIKQEDIAHMRERAKRNRNFITSC